MKVDKCAHGCSTIDAMCMSS